MKRVVDWLSLLFVSVGAMIGSGWMLGPLVAVKTAGVASIFAWILGGLIVMLVALVFAELSAMLPVTGGIARYPQFSHGGFVSFVMTWIAWVAYILLPVVEVQALLQYAANFFPQIVDISTNSQGVHAISLSYIGILAAVVLLSLMSYINLLGIKFATQFNKYLVYVKLIVPLVVSATLISNGFHWENISRISDFSFLENTKYVLKSLPVAGVIFSYFGFRLSVELGGEAKNPQKTLPLSLIGSLLICMVLYTSIQTAFIASMPVELVQDGWHNFSFDLTTDTVSDTGPFVALASILGLTLLVKIILINAVAAPFGSALMVMTTNARLNYAMSVNGYFPKIFEKLNSNQAPIWAIAVNLVLGLVLLLPFPGWQQMVSLIIAALVVSHAIAPICLYSLRQQVPQQHRPFKLPYYKTISRVVFILLNFIAYWTGWNTLSIMFLALFVGLLYLFFYRLTQPVNHKPFLNFKKSTWLWVYLCGLALISYAGDTVYSGHGYLPFGIDLLVLATFSLVIFEWSIKEALTSDQAELLLMKEHEIATAYKENKSKNNNSSIVI